MFVANRWQGDKDPNDFVDYSFDWRGQLSLTEVKDTISSVAWTVPAGLTSEGQQEADGITTIWLGGGTAGEDYRVTCRITTAAGRILERSGLLKVREL